MARGRPVGRGAGGRRGTGRTNHLDLTRNEIFEDVSSEGDVDVALEESAFVVSSPALGGRQRELQEGMRSRGANTTGNSPDLTNFVIDVVNRPQIQKWGDTVDELGNPKQGTDCPGAADPVEGKEKKTWASVVGGNSAEGSKLNYVALSEEGVVEFTEDDLQASASVCNNAIVGQIIEATQVASKTKLPSSSQKWGDRIEEEGNTDSLNSEVTPVLAQGISVEPGVDGQVRKKTWANVVGNRNSANGLQLNYVPPSDEGVVEFTEDDIAAGISAWSTAVVGQIMGEAPRFKEMVGFVHRAWSKIEIPRIHQLQPGVFLFNFKSEESKDKIMARNWFFKKEPILLKNWSPDYKPETKRPTKLPVWVKLPTLNLQFWTKQGIEKIASGIGIPLGTDAFTANREEIKYARVLVEIDLMKPYPSEIRCKLPDGKPYVQKIQYESIPECPKWDFGKSKEQTSNGKEVADPPPPPAAVEKVDVVNATVSTAGPSVAVEALIADSDQFILVSNSKKNKKKKNKKKEGKDSAPSPINAEISQSHASAAEVVDNEAHFAAAVPSSTTDLASSKLPEVEGTTQLN